MEKSQPPRRRYWIFQSPAAGPEVEWRPGTEVRLTIDEYQEEMRPGDVVYVCQTHGDDRIHGWGTLASRVMVHGAEGVDSSELPDYSVRLAYRHDVYPPIRHSDFHADPASELLSGLESVLDALTRPFEELTEEQAAVINGLIRSRGSEAPRDPGAEEESGGEGGATGLTLSELLRKFEFSELSDIILKSAGSFASGRVRDHNRVTSSCLLFAAAEAGRGRKVEESVADFLFTWLKSHHRKAYQKEFEHFRVAEGVAEGGGAEPTFTERSLRVVETAANLARFVSGDDEIRARHLIGALILEAAAGRIGAARRLTNMGVSLPQLRKDYFLFVSRLPDVLSDEEGRWREALIEGRPLPGGEKPKPAEPPRPLLPLLAADDLKGEDLLDITPEVRAFASIIAARDVKTPLSVGLFGDWGSGKSFFISKLKEEVARIAGRVRARAQGEETAYLGNIVQIDFNAWHYAEANLWASLVSHVFENLSLSDERDKRKAEERKQLLLAKLDTTLGARRSAESEVAAKRREEESARASLERARREQTDAGLTLGRVLGRGVWGLVREHVDKEEDVKRLLEDASARLGRAGLPADLSELRQEIAATRGAAGQVHEYLSAIAGDPRRWAKVAALLAATILVPLALTYALRRWPLGEIWDRLVPSVTPLLTLAGGALAWLRSRRREVVEALSVLGKARRRLDEMYDAARVEHEREVRGLQSQLDAKDAEVRAAAVVLQEAEAGVRETVAALRELEPGAVLERFVTERAASEDYRKLLGVVALIRRDFKKLSDLLSQQDNTELREAVREKLLRDQEERNAALRQAGAQGRAPVPGPGVGDEEVEKEMEEYRIERIVLYIDDLDRCPPKQVVDVLQAIHLLLAFELFVVVVGVDARWVRHSLREQFPALLSGDADGDDPHRFEAATPRDYIEKIFQVPFWLRPMGHEGSTDLLLGLIPNSDLRAAPENGTRDAGGRRAGVAAAARAGKDGGAGAATPAAVTGSRAPAPPPADVEPAEGKEPGGTPRSAADAPREAAGGKGSDFILRPDNLRLEMKERDAMVRLAKVIGRTPRSLKRFVNVYRIIKAGLRGGALDTFTGKDSSGGEYRAVLVLLAVAHGAPDLAPAFFSLLRERHEQAAGDERGGGGLKAFLKEHQEPPGGHDFPRAADWRALIIELQKFADGYEDDLPLDVLRGWSSVVVRYTFQLGRMSEEFA